MKSERLMRNLVCPSVRPSVCPSVCLCPPRCMCNPSLSNMCPSNVCDALGPLQPSPHKTHSQTAASNPITFVATTLRNYALVFQHLRTMTKGFGAFLVLVCCFEAVSRASLATECLSFGVFFWCLILLIWSFFPDCLICYVWFEGLKHVEWGWMVYVHVVYVVDLQRSIL